MSDKSRPISPVTNRNSWSRKTPLKENVTLISIVFFIFILLSVLFVVIVRFEFRPEDPEYEEPEDLKLSWICDMPTNATHYVQPMTVTSRIEPSLFCTQEVNDTFIFKNTKRKCLKHLPILIVVASGPQNFAERMNIRSTWGTTEFFEDDEFHRIRLIFSLGMSHNLENDSLKQKIFDENERFGDILQEDFIDDYFNQSLKLLMTFKWIIRHRLPIEFVLKTNDIAHVNTYNLMNFIKQNNRSLLLTGRVQDKCNPSFDSYKTYPRCLYNGTIFKKCINEGDILMSMVVLRELYLTSLKIPLYLIEEVYIGLLAKQAEIQLQHNEKFNIEKVTTSPICVSVEFIVSYKLTPLWSYFLPNTTINILQACSNLLDQSSEIFSTSPLYLFYK